MDYTDYINSTRNQNGQINTGAYDTARIKEINSMYDAQKNARMAELESAYNLSRSDYEASREKIAPQYQQSANDLSTQYEKSRQAFQRQAAASGLNTGTGAQEALARSGQYQRDMGRLRTAEADAFAENRRQQDNLTAKYQSDVAQALANNDYQRAAALLDEYNNSYNRRMQEAEQLAQYGDFSGYSSLYGQDTADTMSSVWNAQNPALAYSMGRITADQYFVLTGQYPPGYNAPVTSGGGGNDNVGGGWSPSFQAKLDAAHAAGGYYTGTGWYAPETASSSASSMASEGMSAHKGKGAG